MNPTSKRRKFRYDPDCYWIVVDVHWSYEIPESEGRPIPASRVVDASEDPVSAPQATADVQLFTFEDAAPARDFMAMPGAANRHGPFPLLRTAQERGAPLLVAAAEALLAVPPGQDDEAERAFLSGAVQLCRFNSRMPDIYRDCRRSLLFEGRRRIGDPRHAIEQAMRPYIEKKHNLNKDKEPL